MNQRKIWIIIILMATAMLGSVFIQSYWIKVAVEEKEETFDRNVYAALLNVAEQLSIDEERNTRSISSMLEKNQASSSSSLNLNLKGMSVLDSLEQANNSAPITRKVQQRFEKEYLNRFLSPVSLAERISPQKLNYYMKLAMEDIGINTSYDYGVWSNSQESFVMINDKFVVEETAAGMSQVDVNKSLRNSKYEVNLFTSQIASAPGKLKIYFPNRTQIVWSDIVPLLIASILFTGIILLSFFYTIYVIFTQKKISEVKTDFINNMTHEFKTPIATISLATDSILNPKVINHEEKVKKFVGLIQQENKRMLSQVEKVLQISQIDKKDLKLKWTSINIHDVISQAVEHINLKLQARNGSAISFLEADDPIIEGDLTHVSNIIHNLLDNAFKYSPEDPKIEVQTKNRDEGVEIRVKDNGIGMTKESRKHIFEKFYRVPTGNLHDVKGFGLGLSYVKAMVDAHHGNVDVESELGKGSTFILYFPHRKAA